VTFNIIKYSGTAEALIKLINTDKSSARSGKVSNFLVQHSFMNTDYRFFSYDILFAFLSCV